MASILYEFLGDHISIERVDLLDQLVEYTINAISNQDEQVRIVECLNSLNTLAKNDTTRGKTAVRARPGKSALSSDNEQLVDNVRSSTLVTDGVGVGLGVGLVKNFAVDAKYQQTLEKIIARVCYPLFECDLERNFKLTTSASGGVNIFHAACELCLTCLSLANRSQIRNIIYDAALVSLQAYVEEQRFSENMKSLQLDSVIPIYTTLEILSQLFEKSTNNEKGQITFCILIDNDWLDAFFLELLNVIEHAEDAVCGLVATILIPKSLKCSDATDKKVLILWERIKQMLSSSKPYVQDDINHSNNCFIVLCAFINYFHPNTNLLDQQDILAAVLSENLFWGIIQNGFSKGDSLTRKRALYLLKRAVELSEGIERLGGDGNEGTLVPLFQWRLQNQAALVKLWSDIILILETLEEIQIHVVMPVMTRLSKVIEATYLTASGWPLLHTSWLVVIFERLFQHATKTISRWGVTQVMSLDLSTCPIFSQVGSKFVLGPVLQALSDYTLYIKTTEKSQSRFSDATEMMLGFFTTCVASLPVDQAKVFLQELLSAFVDLRTKPVPLAFLCQSLARVPSFKAWGNSSMKCLRDLMSSGISTIQPLHRGAIQCFLMDSAINLMDAADISLHQLWTTLAVLNRDECMQRGTILWEKIANWLQVNAFELKLNTKVQSLFEAIQLEVIEYMTISHSDGTPTMSSAKEATKVARMLLLIVDANHRAK
ncbi:probable methyltransferase TARBP1 [Anneissia japonica]|uniref:probable methyltransferase TARBP1 n=1 Tax=Anneissia japonica TaxID=1529436 RepID=UPI0014256733|nr:probable methyltransferase TARBP1 [Anneissia japonica]